MKTAEHEKSPETRLDKLLKSGSHVKPKEPHVITSRFSQDKNNTNDNNKD